MKRRIEISTPSNFNFEATVVSHGWYLLEPFRWDPATRVLTRAEALDNRALSLRFSWKKQLVIESDMDLTPHASLLRARARRMFQLDVDTSAFIALCEQAESHQHVARRGFGRLLCGSTRFEDVVKIIATTNTTWRQTMRMVELLVGQFGARGKGIAAFPTPTQIAALSAETIASHCKFGYRSRYLLTLARGIEHGSIDLDGIASGDPDTPELFRRFKELPGIGPYGAAHLLAMEGRHDYIAIDTEFRRFVKERYHKGRNVRDATLLRHYNRWGRWKYLAYWAELWEAVLPVLKGREKSAQ